MKRKPTPITVIFPARLKQIRGEQGLSQRALAVAAGIGERSLRGYESGANEPTIAVVEALARALGIQPVELICEK